MLRESGLNAIFEAGDVPAGCHLVGDTGYPSEEAAAKAYLRPQSGPQTNYNRPQGMQRREAGVSVADFLSIAMFPKGQDHIK
ncbi:hypothetical protein E2C01_083022 [Portunus trituberculatus]|uniref:DDE Tnp4 domain-containing protein n=1 Tax=Portunus trituberculatus TaxID=210409 RepID=A0A5B7J0M8_PORTR|nr:hypothetical protein [Portunus trituberculatus]